MEIWKTIKCYENYSVSNYGNIRRDVSNTFGKKGHIIKQGKNGRYNHFTPIKNGRQKTVMIHTIVAYAFLGKRPKGKQINHKDGIRTNNHIDNLEYVTQKENAQHSISLGLWKPILGEKNHHAKLKEWQILKIRKLHSEGVSQRKLAKMFKVHFGNINCIVLRYTWKHI